MTRHSRFTLVELMAVIAIIAILAGIVLGGLSFATRKSMEAQTIARMEQFQIALENFHKDYGYYPVSPTSGTNYDVDFDQSAWDLFVSKSGNKNNNKPYMEGIYPGYGKYLDGNGEPFQYQYPNTVTSRNTTKYALWSKGADASSGTDDDISSWKQK